MSNKLRDIVYEIQYKLDLTLEQVAEKIGYSRTYLSKAINNGTEGKLLDTILRKFPDIAQHENLIKETRSEGRITITGDEDAILTQMNEIIMAHSAAIKVLLFREAEAEAKRTGESFASVYTRLEKEVADVVRQGFQSDAKIFR